ncbi:MAG: N-acetyl sugar amidotransferase [Bdellovibrionales bacterium]|nr:N-acetyl sugar amidotransferase [Bdellovibrionales bacterium]
MSEKSQIKKIRYCAKCVLPEINPWMSSFDENGVCKGCRAAVHKEEIDWEKRRVLFEELINEYRSESDYDCIIPVSGGKDSYFACHIAKEFNLKPLLVTYHGNNYLPECEENLQRMRHEFDADHIIFRPSEDMLIKLNRLGFKLHGDMNWHGHCGIFTYPMQIAVKYKIPLVWWGDHGFTEQGGMYSHNDFFEYTAKDRYENALHGFDWYDWIEDTEGLTKKDLRWAMYPSDEEIMEAEVRGIFLSNYFYYDGYYNAKISKEFYNWQEARQPFERTYRMISNIDDMHENGMHDYMKYIKFGYGRGTDHSCYDIRLGLMTREEGIEMVRKYDHVKSKDLDRWLKYVDMKEEEFDQIADTFRNERIWTKINGEWKKCNIWDKE